jgi:hypothetical protein
MWGTPYYNDGEDWTHANGLYARASDGSLLLSLAGLNMVAEVDGDTGEINWTVLGSQVTPSDAAFALQHSPSWTPDGTLLIFANESHQREFSWVGEYTFHGEDGLQEIWSAGLDEELHTAALGHAARHADGNTLVAYGTIGVVREFSPSGSVLREISYDASVNLTELDVAVATP